MCVKCEKFYTGQINRNFKTRLKEPKKKIIYGEGCSNFSSHVIEQSHEIKNMDNIMTILHNEKINKLEELEILKEPHHRTYSMT